MPERLQLTGPPEQAAAQLIADLERRGIMERQEDMLGKYLREKHHELQDCIVKNHELKKENEELKCMNKILERQIGRLMSLSAELARPSASGVRRGRGRRGNMDTILEASPP